MRFSINFIIATISAAAYLQVRADQTHVKRVVKEFGKRHYVTSPNTQPQINPKENDESSYVNHTPTSQRSDSVHDSSSSPGGEITSPSGRDSAGSSEDDDSSPSEEDNHSSSGVDGSSASYGDVNGMTTAYQQAYTPCETFTRTIQNPTVDIQVAINAFNTFEQQFSSVASNYGSRCNQCSTTDSSKWIKIVTEFASSVDQWILIFSTRLQTFTTQCTTWSRFNQSFKIFIQLAISLQINVKQIFLNLNLHLNLWVHFKISALGLLDLNVSAHAHLGTFGIPFPTQLFGGLGGSTFPTPATLNNAPKSY